MNRSELIDRYKLVCKTLELDAELVVVSAGGACVMHGLRDETADLDIHIPRGSLYNGIRNRARMNGCEIRYMTRPGQPTESIQYYSWLSIAPLDRNFSTEEIDGVHVYDLRSLLLQKLSLNRPKDQKDIRVLMNTYLETEHEALLPD